MSRYALLLAGLALGVACSGTQRPSGPAPEYERPELPAWDAAPQVDPLDQIEGEEVTDDEPSEVPETDAGSGPDGASGAPDAGLEGGG